MTKTALTGAVFFGFPGRLTAKPAIPLPSSQLDMQAPTKSPPRFNEAVELPDQRNLVLEEVNFKWLMAGVGWCVDMSRFRSDLVYASHYLNLAKSSESMELRNCACQLQQQMGIDWQ